MDNEIPALTLPVQMFVLGTAVGMAIAIANYRRTGSTEHWPIFIAYGGLSALAAGLLFVLIRALT